MNPVAFSACLVALLSTSAFAAPDLVSSFSEAFSKTLESDDLGKKLLDVSKSSPEEVGKSAQTVLQTLFQLLGDPVGGGDELAKENGETIRQNFASLSPPQLASALGKLVGDLLNERNVLTEDNASELGKKLAESNIAAAKIMDISTPKGKWLAIFVSAAKFLASFGLYEKDYAQELTKDFSRIVGCLEKNC